MAELSATYHRNETDIIANRNPDFMGETQTFLIEDARPNRRIGASADVQPARGIGTRLTVRHIGELATPFIFEDTVTIEAAAVADAEVNFRIADRTRLSLGAG